MSDDSFHDYTRFGEMEFLISEFNKLESSLSNAEVSFVFREQIFCVSLIKKYTNKDYTSSLGHLGYPESDLSLLFWRAFDPFCEEVLLIFPKDEMLNISSETAKIIFSAYHCSSLVRFSLAIRRTYAFEFLSLNPNSVVMKIFGDWKFADSVNWVQAKLILNASDSTSLIQSCIKSQYQILFPRPLNSSNIHESITLPIGRYFGSPKVKLLLYFLNPSVKSGLFEYEFAPIILSKLEIEAIPDSILQVGAKYLGIFCEASNSEIIVSEKVILDRNTKVIQFSKLYPTVSPELIQFVLFRKTPASFSERFYTSLIVAFFEELKIENDRSRFIQALGVMCRLYTEIIQAVKKLASSENLNIYGLMAKPQWSDPLVVQYISSIEFMLDCVKREMIKSPQNKSNLKKLNSDDLIGTPED